MSNSLHKSLPPNARSLVDELLETQHVTVKIAKKRKTKHGDFRVFPNGDCQISVNNNLNPYQFLLTLVHEIAHLRVFKDAKRDKTPHGTLWKTQFKHLMLPFLKPDIFPLDLLPHLAKYLKNPKASTGSDVKLSRALKQYDVNSGKNFIFELKEGTAFKYNNKIYVLGKKRRTRFECLAVQTQRIYLFNQNTEIEPE